MKVEEWMYDAFVARFGRERWQELFRPVFPGQEHLLAKMNNDEIQFWRGIKETQAR